MRYRIKEIASRAELSNFFRPGGIGVELGVQEGDHAELLVKYSKARKIHLVDFWSYQAKERTEFLRPEWSEHKQKVLERFAPEIENGRVEVHDMPFVEFLSRFPDEYFDWAYLDGWHQYHDVIRDIGDAAKKVKILGIFGGHDFLVEPNDWKTGVPRAVIELIQSGYGPMIGLSNEKNSDWLIQRGGVANVDISR